MKGQAEVNGATDIDTGSPTPSSPMRGYVLMTVCIAAICQPGMILALSDRMLTVGDTQYEPPSEKITQLTTAIAVLSSGDAGFQRELLNLLQIRVSSEVLNNPNIWLPVADVVNMYIACRNEAKARRAEQTILAPMGLTTDRFLMQQSVMSAGLVDSIARDIINFQVPSVGCIVCGIDASGAHIYSIYDGVAICHDSTGFACVGSGATHASSQFMLWKHGPNQQGADTLLLAYIAKRRSEVAPGVGRETDIIGIGPRLGAYAPIKTELLTRLEDDYNALRKAEEAAFEGARRGVADFIASLPEQSGPLNQERGTTDALAPSDGTPVPDPSTDKSGAEPP